MTFTLAAGQTASLNDVFLVRFGVVGGPNMILSSGSPFASTDNRGNKYASCGSSFQSLGGDAAFSSDFGRSQSASQVVFSSIGLGVALVAGDVITVHSASGGGAITNGVICVVDQFTSDRGFVPTWVENNDADEGTSATPSRQITPTQAGDLVYCAIQTNGPSGDAFTQDTDTTNGSWVSLTRSGTAGGSATTNVTSAGGYKIVSAAGVQTYNPAITSRRWGMSMILLSENPPIKPHPIGGGGNKKTIDPGDVTTISQAVNRSARWMKRRSGIVVPRLWTPADGIA